MLSALHSNISKLVRSSGQALDVLGRTLEVHPYIEKLQPSTRLLKLGSSIPEFNGNFIAPTATVIGKVKIGANSSVWYGAVVRGDVNSISIGEGVVIDDRAMVHCSGGGSSKANFPTVIKNGSMVGKGAIVHGSTLEENSVVGAGAQVMDGAVVGKGSVLAPGSFLSMKKVVPAGQLWGGIPAKYQRDISAEEAKAYAELASENIALAVLHSKECEKTWEVIEQEEYDFEQLAGRSDSFYRRLSPEEISERLGEVERRSVPGRVLDSPISSRGPDSRLKENTI